MDDLRSDLAQRLDELEAHIGEVRKTLEQQRFVSDQLQREWDDMMRQHAELRRRLRSGEVKGSEAAATLEEDIDVLRHAFFRWAARVDKRYSAGAPDGS
ncbi:MAG: hypothetical protein DIU57_006185 [Pseudomonadota bacterium]|jgi:phage shock protein A|nr:MAG: hypothetical protein DIU57_19670 [Pseudomonadota bacterium]